MNLHMVRGSGRVVEEKRQVSGFTGVNLAGIGTLYIELGAGEELRIEAEDNLMRYFETEVRNGMLRIKHQDRVNLRPQKPVSFYLTVKELDTIGVSGSGEIEAPGLSAKRLSVSVSGSGDVEMGDLAADALEAKISGSGSVDIAGGNVEKQDVTISGSGKYEARDMESARARVRVTGSGEVTIRVRDHLQANIIGSGDVRYVGSPTVDKTVIGSGAVEEIGGGHHRGR
jgi:hypothetical protein